MNGETTFLILSLILAVALIVAIWKLGNSVPAWVIDIAQSGARVAYDYAKGTEQTLDDEIWLDVMKRLDALEEEQDADNATPSG